MTLSKSYTNLQKPFGLHLVKWNAIDLSFLTLLGKTLILDTSAELLVDWWADNGGPEDPEQGRDYCLVCLCFKEKADGFPWREQSALFMFLFEI